MSKKLIKITSLGRLESRKLRGFYFWQKPKVAKTFYVDFIFLDSSDSCAEVSLGDFVGFRARDCEIRL